jgi:arabinose-5-phosphate isomerase
MSPARRLHANPVPTSAWCNIVERGRGVLRAEQHAIARVEESLNQEFARGVELLLNCRGQVIVSGIGKAGIIGQKLAASLSSTGTPSHFLHPSEAVHGDLGSVRPLDLVLLLSYSGETDEVTRLLTLVKQVASSTMAITAHPRSTLAAGVDVAILIGQQAEACPLGLAPSCSTTAMLAVGDALALVVCEQRGFTREQFAGFHPAGGLGKQLTRVEEVMRPLQACRVALATQTVREVLIHVGRPGRRTGAIMLTCAEGELVGIFTDSDLARLLENSHESQLDRPVSEVMTHHFQTVTAGSYLPEALRILAQRKISELPVVTAAQRPLGIVDITDVMSVMSELWSPNDRPATPIIGKTNQADGDRSTETRRQIIPLVAHRPTTASPRGPYDSKLRTTEENESEKYKPET